MKTNLCAALAIALAVGGCEPASTQEAASRPLDVRFDPTPVHIVAEMLNLAKVGIADVVFDLGCGDGRIVIAAAKEYKARSVCVELDPRRIHESRANAARSGMTERIVFVEQDLFDTDLTAATVVTLFLSPEANLKLRPKLLRELKPGARVVSYVHDMGDWLPHATRNVTGPHGPRRVYLWTISHGARP